MKLEHTGVIKPLELGLPRMLTISRKTTLITWANIRMASVGP